MVGKANLVCAWWREGLRYRWLVKTLAEHAVLLPIKVVMGSGGLVLAVIAVLNAVLHSEPEGFAGRMFFVIAAVYAAAWAMRWWVLPWPRAAESIMLVASADIFITVVSVRTDDELQRVGGLLMLIIVGVYVTLLHSPRLLVAHAVWSVASAVVLTLPLWSGGRTVGVIAVLSIMTAINALILPGVQFCVWLVWTEILADPLTQLLSRRGLEIHAAALGGRVRRVAVCVMVIDLDHFKTVNDTFGHHVGDALLLDVADKLRSAVPDGIAVARLGGDEFALLGEMPMAAAESTAERLRAAVAAPGVLPPVTASIGVAVREHYNGCDLEWRRAVRSLLRRADIAMYLAKQQGGNAVVHDRAFDDAGM